MNQTLWHSEVYTTKQSEENGINDYIRDTMSGLGVHAHNVEFFTLPDISVLGARGLI